MSLVIDPSWTPKLFRPVEHNVDAYLNLIRTQGYRVYWEMASECACMANSDSDHADATCPICHGDRYEYHSGVETYAIITDISTDPNIVGAFGQYDNGLSRITVRAEQVPSIHDRYTLLDSYCRLNAFVVRGEAGQPDVLRPPVAIRSIVVDPGANAEPVNVGVIHLRLVNSDGTAGPVRVEGTDFTVDEDGAIDWTLGEDEELDTAPAEGQKYSITYFARPRYLAVSHPHAARDAQKKLRLPEAAPSYLPVQVLAHLDNRVTTQ